ncbi:MAG: hypothetical protein LBB91_09075 [Clostridiales bacterium]|jgi:predicted HTH transcriptional regulator|nr:hypothetical protein [Clostridiales bacterium]
MIDFDKLHTYKENNHHDNTFRRDGEGDYRCSKEEILSMLRDNAIKTQDMLVLENMDNRVFNYDIVKAYRNRMKLTRPDHVWEGLPDDEFLYKLGAIGLGESKEHHPTAAGLLMFGNDYEIVHEYGNYFAAHLGLSDGRIRKLFIELAKKNLIKKVGDNRYAHYVLVRADE